MVEAGVLTPAAAENPRRMQPKKRRTIAPPGKLPAEAERSRLLAAELNIEWTPKCSRAGVPSTDPPPPPPKPTHARAFAWVSMQGRPPAGGFARLLFCRRLSRRRNCPALLGLRWSWVLCNPPSRAVAGDCQASPLAVQQPATSERMLTARPIKPSMVKCRGYNFHLAGNFR